MGTARQKIFLEERTFIALVLVMLLTWAPSSGACPGALESWTPLPVALEERIGDSSQVLLVVNGESALYAVTIYALEKREGRWRDVFGPIPSVIGKGGFAPPGEKREGDGRTPSGIFPLGTAFGYEPTAATKMPYRQAAADDVWVDDPGAADYNRWVKKGKTKAASFEYLRRKDDLYRYAVVIEYNTRPIVPGAGSAIFLHIWKGPAEPTLGCVAVSTNDILRIFRWLDPSAKPLIVMDVLKR